MQIFVFRFFTVRRMVVLKHYNWSTYTQSLWLQWLAEEMEPGISRKKRPAVERVLLHLLDSDWEMTKATLVWPHKHIYTNRGSPLYGCSWLAERGSSITTHLISYLLSLSHEPQTWWDFTRENTVSVLMCNHTVLCKMCVRYRVFSHSGTSIYVLQLKLKDLRLFI